MNRSRNTMKTHGAAELQSLWMKAGELREASIEMDVSIVQIGRAFAVDERTSRRWMSGEILVPAGVSVLIRLLVALKRKLSYREMAAALRREAEMLDALADAKEAKMRQVKPQTQPQAAA